MTILETYPIHRCVFRNDPTALKELLMDKEIQKRINEYDNHGNTPLHLALMLNRHNCIVILLKYDSDVFSRNYFGWNPMDEASMIGDIDVIEKMSYFKWKEYVDILGRPGGYLDQWNATTPYLSLKLKGKIRTTIPLLQKFGLKDIQQLYKKGKNVRVDSTLGGIDTRKIPKVIRSHISILLKCDESTNQIKIYLLDHKKKIYQEFYPNIPEWYLSNSLKSRVGANTLYKFFIDMSKFSLTPVKGKLLKKGTKSFTMEDGKTYKCVHYKGKKIGIVIKKRCDEGYVGECQSVITEKEEKEVDIKKSSSKKSKEKKFSKSGSSSSLTSSTSSTVSDDDSDTDSAFNDSDDDSDNESNPSKGNNNENTKVVPEFIDKLYHNDKGKEHHDQNKVMYTIEKDGHTTTFEKETDIEDTLDWEQAYQDKYAQNNDLIYSFINGKKDNTRVKHLSPKEIEDLKLKKISEDEYFDPSSKDYLHLGKVMTVTKEKKDYKYKIKFWMCKESSNFPISAYDLKPIFEYVLTVLLDQVKSNEYSSEMDKQTYEYLTKTMLDIVQSKHSFPVKMSIPIYPSIAFQMTTLNCSVDPNSIPDELFEIPSDYTIGNVYFQHIHN